MKIEEKCKRIVTCFILLAIFSPFNGKCYLNFCRDESPVWQRYNVAGLTTAGSTIPKAYNSLAGNDISSRQPNVILVMTDDQGYGDICANGNPYLKTPNLDRLHVESVRLVNFHTDPSCSPTRAAVMTGQYSARSGVWHTTGGRSLMAKDKTTMAEVFQMNGYATGIFGKWHLGDAYPFRPQDQGFEESVVHGGGIVGSGSDYYGNDYNDDTYLHNGKPEKYSGYSDRVWFTEASRFIRQNKQRPFFCYLATNIPHAPLRVDEKYAAPYRAAFSDRLANYYGMITEFDESLGTLLSEIKELGLEDNTIVIFMSDNGPCPWFGGVKISNEGFVQEGFTAGMRGGKIWGYENAHRQPCFIRWPAGGLQKGKDVHKLTAHVDLLPTLMQACRLKKIPAEKLDGLSLVPLLKGDELSWPGRTIVIQNQRVDFPVKYKEYQVLSEHWRLINPYQKELEDMTLYNKGKADTIKPPVITNRHQYELYDIQQDPGQKTNLASQFPAVVKQLNKNYEDWWASVSPNFHTYNNLIIGARAANTTLLYGHDAHIKKDLQVWAIEVAGKGRYKIELAHWPKEAGKRISENRRGENRLSFKQAQLQVGNIRQQVNIGPNDKLATFYIDLPAGKTSLQAFFTNIDQQKLNAEFVYVDRVASADSKELAKYKPLHPDKLLKK